MRCTSRWTEGRACDRGHAGAQQALSHRADLRLDVAIDLDSHPFDIPAVREIGNIAFHPNVTFFVGENGSGKSTVLEALAVALGFSPEGGTRNVRFGTTPSLSPLHDALRIARGVPRPHDGYFRRAESFFNVATYMDTVGDDRPSLHSRSHGEAFLSLLLDRFRGDGLYLLDDPEAALSPSRQLVALRAIQHLVLGASQFIIATHSPILLAYPHARIVQFDRSGVGEVAYEETEHYAITRDFLNAYPRRLQQLLGDDADGAGDR